MRILPPCLGKLLQEHLKHLSWRGWVWLPPGTVLTPLFQGFGAGEELGCREKAPFWLWTDPIWRVATQVVLAVTGLAAEGCGTQPWPGQAGGISCHTGTAVPPCPLFPHPCCPWECTELEPRSRRLPLLPRSAAHIKPNMFLRAFQFLMKTSAFTLSLASARRYFGHRRCSASPGIGDGSVFLLALARWGVLFGAGHASGTAAGSRHIPIPGSTSRCQLCQPTPQHGTGLGGIPASHGCSSVAGWEGDTWKPQQAEPRGKTNSP